MRNGGVGEFHAITLVDEDARHISLGIFPVNEQVRNELPEYFVPGGLCAHRAHIEGIGQVALDEFHEPKVGFHDVGAHKKAVVVPIDILSP